MPFYLSPEQDDSNQELQVCIAEAGGRGVSAATIKVLVRERKAPPTCLLNHKSAKDRAGSHC